jgi:hypothetical protein
MASHADGCEAGGLGRVQQIKSVHMKLSVAVAVARREQLQASSIHSVQK